MKKIPNRDDVVHAFRSDRLLKLGLLTVIASTIFFGISGAAVGWMLGKIAPDYYLVTVDFDGDYDPAAVGLGLGTTQGVVAGALVGCVVLLSTAWYKSRIEKAILKEFDER